MSKRLPYHAGRKGRNRIRAYRHTRDGKLYLEWWESGGRKSLKLPDSVQALEVEAAEEEARNRADELAAELVRIDDFKEVEKNEPSKLTLAELFDRYGREKTPLKGVGKQGHDRRATLIFRAFVDSQPEPERRSSRSPATLDSVDWDRFIAARREGRIPGFERPVGDRQVGYDLKFVIAVLNWALGVKENGKPILVANPWSGSIRKAQGWSKIPREENPHRPSMPLDLEQLLIAHSPNWQFEAALRLGRLTGRRNNAIRQLRWSDVDLTDEEIVWRAGADKVGKQSLVPLPPAAVEVFRALPSRGIGGTPVFPSKDDPSKSTPRYTFQVWLRRAKARAIKAASEAERPALRERFRGVGFHSEKRSFVRDPEFRSKPPKIQEAFVGTKHSTLREVYDEVTTDDLREAMGFKTTGNREHEPRVAEGTGP